MINEKGILTDRQKQHIKKLNNNLKKKQQNERKKNSSVENWDNKKNRFTIRPERQKKIRGYSKSITSNKKLRIWKKFFQK